MDQLHDCRRLSVGVDCAELFDTQEKGGGMIRVVSVLVAMLLVAGCGVIQPVTHAQTDGALCSLYGIAKGQHRDRIYAEIQNRELIPDQYWEDVDAGRLTVGMPVCAIRAAAGREAVRMHSEYGITSSYANGHKSAGAYRPALDGEYRPSRDGWYRPPLDGAYRPPRDGVNSRSHRMNQLRNDSALWAYYHSRSRIYGLGTTY